MTMDDWGAAIEEALRPTSGSSGGKTVGDIIQETGRGLNSVRRMLRVAANKGMLEVHQERRLAIDGTYRFSPAYKLKGGQK